ncbi:glycosyltransferase family 50 protein [Myriangium duriaei CBS 260.36]|uniref:GPI mannosyltransferase 1 n=1 Tax=Myriangium duriaei CBS 260.36 TaxID=1168546 RepID=A0A9P4J3V8_9PEZI|nr:glycosyltransferase family 50 protein [Myriangium duriaei CBS 260.36]
MASSRIWNPRTVTYLAILLRVVLLAWGKYQDTHSPLKYTDIDYLVFTDAAKYLKWGVSPYIRDTYRYTPLLAWVLYPTNYYGFFDFGKWLFASGDILAGLLIYSTLRGSWYGFNVERASKYAAVWVLNPMVANISTRGSSEGLLAVFVVAIVWSALRRNYLVTGLMLGLAVHFKLYPFIYAATLFFWVWSGHRRRPNRILWGLYSDDLIALVGAASSTWGGLNTLMYNIYGDEFFYHSYFYHYVRTDHRHNFSIYNTLLHLQSAVGSDGSLRIPNLSFYPQLYLSLIGMPWAMSGKSLAGTMLAQTFAFVTFNKVCTSQYFLWYMVFLPLYLPDSTFMKRPKLGISCLIAWIVGQAGWLQQGYELEFLGVSTFAPGLWLWTIFFFAVNCIILRIIVSDISERPPAVEVISEKKTN